jgi:Fe-S cluster assembly scaffold protein SufB
VRWLGAGHASATGRFDDEHLFYLMSRGIREDEARKLVVRGFFAELLDKIPVEELRTRWARPSRPGSQNRGHDVHKVCLRR